MEEISATNPEYVAASGVQYTNFFISQYMTGFDKPGLRTQKLKSIL